MKKIIVFTFIGAVVGYIVSYFFQPKLLQKTISLVTYCTDVGDVLLKNKFGGMSQTIVISIVVCAIIGGVIAYISHKK